MPVLARSTLTAIGVDVGSRMIRVAQLRRGSKWRLHAAAVLPRSGFADAVSEGAPASGAPQARAASGLRALTDAECARLAGTLFRQGFEGKDIILAAPDQRTFVGSIEVPARSSGAPVLDIARTEAARALRADPQAVEVRCWDLPGTAGDTHPAVMAGALAHEDAEPVLDAVEAQGLRVRSLDLRAWALARVARLVGSTTEPEPFQTILELGWHAAHLVLVRKGRVAYTRRLLEGGLSVLFEAISGRLHLDAPLVEHLVRTIGVGRGDTPAGQARQAQGIADGWARALADEVSVSVGYASNRFGGSSSGRVLAIGAGATIPGLCDALTAGAGASVKPLLPADFIDVPEALSGLRSESALVPAIGLAIPPEEVTR